MLILYIITIEGTRKCSLMFSLLNKKRKYGLKCVQATAADNIPVVHIYWKMVNTNISGMHAFLITSFRNITPKVISAVTIDGITVFFNWSQETPTITYIKRLQLIIQKDKSIHENKSIHEEKIAPITNTSSSSSNKIFIAMILLVLLI